MYGDNVEGEEEMQKSTEGYFTVEAALVLPMVLGVVLLIIYLLFFQYNRCLQEMDMGVLALRGRVLQTKNHEERMLQLREQADAVYTEKYLAWSRGRIELKLEKGTVSVKQCSHLRFPFGGMKHIGDIWETETEYTNHIISPVSVIRSYRKVIGGQ